jgi:glycosyltransferase involved in cell wall biosynthesis
LKKVLIITYYWPPSGGAGVQRWLKFSKYLPGEGIEPIILTVNPNYANYPQRDPGLVDEVPGNVKVFQTKTREIYNLYKTLFRKKETEYGGFVNDNNNLGGKFSRFIRGNFFHPDPRKGWNRYAKKKGLELIEKFDIKTVITSSPPHSSQLIGLYLKKKKNVYWIADLRDPWTDIFYYNKLLKLPPAKTLDKRTEKKVLTRADQIFTVSQPLASIFKNKIHEDKFKVIPNGYDEEDFHVPAFKKEDVYTITYTGTINSVYQPTIFFQSLSHLKSDYKFKIRFVGKVSEDLVSVMKRIGIHEYCEFIPYVEHSKSIKYLLKSDMLFLAIPSTSNNKGILTGKLFEYLAAKKPILCIGPTDGDAAYIINRCKVGECFNYYDEAGILQFLKTRMKNRDNPLPSKYDENAIYQYSRKFISRELANELRKIEVW